MPSSKRKRSVKRSNAATSNSSGDDGRDGSSSSVHSHYDVDHHDGSGGEGDGRARKKSKTVLGPVSVSSPLLSTAATTTTNKYNNEEEEEPCLVSMILQRLKDICLTKSRCSAAVQAIPRAKCLSCGVGPATKSDSKDGKPTSSSSSTPTINSASDDTSQAQADANILMLATILLQKLLAARNHAGATKENNQDKSDRRNNKGRDQKNDPSIEMNVDSNQQGELFLNHDDGSVAIVQANVALLLSHILMVNKTVLERTINCSYGVGSDDAVSVVSFSTTATGTLSSSNPQQQQQQQTSASVITPMRDARTILVKAILTVMMTALDSYQSISMICSSSNSSSKKVGVSKFAHLRHALQCNLYSLETLLCMQKRKPNNVISSVASSTGDVCVPPTIEHAHSWNMSPRGECVWNSLLWDMEGRGCRGNARKKDVACGKVDSDKEIASIPTMKSLDGGLVGTVLWDNVLVQAMTQEFRTVSELLGVGPSTVVSESPKETTNDCDCSWMMSLLLDSSSTRGINVQTVATSAPGPPVRRKRKAKKGVSSMSEKISQMSASNTNELAEKQIKKYLLDGNISSGSIVVRRFCNMVLVHTCFGHYHLLQGLVHILNDSMTIDINKTISSVDETDQKLHDDNALLKSLTWRNIINPMDMEWPTFERIIETSRSPLGSDSESIDEDGNEIKKSKTMASEYITPTLALSALSNRVIDIVKESGKLCGAFPAKNGIEEFITKYWNPYKGVVFANAAEKVMEPTASNKVDRSGRPSIYNISVELLRLMIVNHGRCLEEIALLSEKSKQARVSLEDLPFTVIVRTRPIYEDSIPTGYIMLNEEEVVSYNGFREYGCYHPSLHNTIEALILCISMSSSTNENKNCKVLYGVAAAFALQNSVKVHKCSRDYMKKKATDSGVYNQRVDELVVFDAKLCSFAVHQFSDILGNITSVTRESSGTIVDRGGSMNSELIRHFSLNLPVIPQLDVIFAGLIAKHVNIVEARDDNRAVSGHLLSLFFRVMLPYGEKVSKSKVTQVPDNLMRMLVRMVDGCFTFQEYQNDSARGSLRKGNNFTRYSLAADCLDSIRKAIEHIPMGAISSFGDMTSMLKLRSAIRKLTSMSIAESFVYLGSKLEEIIVHQKMKNVSSCEVLHMGSSLPVMNGKLDYERVEHRLWASYVKCCLSFVRGTTSYVPKPLNWSGNNKKLVLGNAKERMHVFKKIAHLTTSTDTKWPLYISAVHHVMVSGQLTADPVPRNLKDALPEKFICEGFIESIRSALNDPQMDIINKYNDFANQKVHSSDVEIPLSIRDARLFAIALCRIPGKERQTLLSRFVRMLHDSLLLIVSNRDLRNLFNASPLCTGFLARTLTACSSIIDIVSAGDQLLENLCDCIGQLHYNLPNLSIRREECNENGVFDITSRFRRESCFMSLWLDWQSPALPCVEVRNLIDPLCCEDIAKYRMTLANAFEIGCESAKYDYCHLIFASWNASAKMYSFEKSVWTGPSTAKAMAELTNAQKIFQIRNDIFHLHKELVQNVNDMPESYLSSRLQELNKDHPEFYDPCRGVNYIRLAMTEIIKMLQTLVASLDNNNEVGVRSDDFILMEALLSYVSFLLAMCTTSDLDLCSVLSPRKRTQSGNNNRGSRNSMDDAEYSEDSDDSFEDEEIHDDSQMDDLSRLNQLCGIIGASPCHPDWLDDRCKLRQGISEQFCLENAAEIIRILTDFGITAFSKYGKCLSEVFSVYSLSDSKSVVDGSSLLRFVQGAQNVELGSHSNSSSKEWEYVSQAFDVNTEVIHSVFTGVPCKNTEAAKEMFASYSGQLIKGRLQDNFGSTDGNAPEYRAGGEWELLLSNALISPCSRLDVSTEKASQIHLGSTCIRWRRVLNCIVNTLVPANALLRFSLNGSKGRTRHRAINGNYAEIPPKNIACQTSPMHTTFEAGMDFSKLEFLHTLKGIVSKNLCFLCEVQSSSFCEVGVRKAAGAACGHLVASEKDITNVKGVLSMRNSLIAVTEITSKSKFKNGVKLSAALDVLIDSSVFLGSPTFDQESYLLFCFKAKELKISTILEEYVDLRTILSKYPCRSTCAERWDWTKCPLNEIKIINAIIQGEYKNITKPKVRSTFIVLMKNVIASEMSETCEIGRSALLSVKQTVLDLWGNLGSKQLQTFVKNDICVIGNNSIAALSSDRSTLFHISCQLSSFIAALLSVSGNSDSNENIDIMFSTILNVLEETIQHWVGKNGLGHIMCILCVLSIRYGTLIDVGNVLLTMTKKKMAQGLNQHLLDLELFYRYLLDAHRSLSHEPSIDLDHREKSSAVSTETDEIINLSRELRTCSFAATHGEFTEQHWYNCYTCGLIWDKGCCSLCAQICHKGHDVGYSRKSSFFCDCGAEVRTSVGKISCKCLSPVSNSLLASICNNSSMRVPHQQNSDDYVQQKKSTAEENDLRKETTKVMSDSELFRASAQKSIRSFISSVNKTLICDLFDIFKTNYDSWLDKNMMQNIVARTFGDMNESFTIPSAASFSMSRNGVQLDLRKLVDQSFSPLRMTTTNTVNTNIASDTNEFKLKANLLTKNVLERNILVADSCGRMIVADSRRLFFLGALPLVNTRHISNPLENVLHYSQLCITGSYTVDFDVVGMAICQGRERHVLVWGLTTAKCVILGAGFDKVEISIDLDLELENIDFDFESDYIVKAEWVSGTIISIFCSTCVKLFDIENKCVEISSTIICTPSLSHVIRNHDAIIRSGVVITSSMFHGDSEETFIEAASCVKRIYILLDSGRIHLIDFKVGIDGGLIEADDVIINCHDAIVLPIAGIKRTGGSCGEPVGATSLSLGEGTSLVYLRQSGLLLYKCSSSPVVAFSLNACGDIVGNFEFLPDMINGEVCGHSDNEGIRGPFSNWIELGSIHKENLLFYRAAFIGLTSKSRKAQIMYIEYNRERSFLKKMTMPGNVHLILNGATSIDSLAAFSGPIVMGHSRNDGMMGRDGYVRERLYFVSITSNGVMTFHAEDLNIDSANSESSMIFFHRRRAHSDSGIQFETKIRDDTVLNDVPTSQPLFPITIFETWENVTHRDELVLTCDGVDETSKIMKKKLGTGTSDCVVANSKDGCTITIRLRPHHELTRKSVSMGKDLKDLVIVAVRVLLGTSTIDFFPTLITVMGRPIKPTRQKKRWYDVPLTDEEILLVSRMGFIPIYISGSTESDQHEILIDSIEVYAEHRDKLQHIFSTRKDETIDPKGPVHISDTCCSQTRRQLVNSSIAIISHVVQLLGGSSSKLADVSNESLLRLIRVTALDSPEIEGARNHVVEILNEMKSDSKERQRLLDEGTLIGICGILNDLEELVKNACTSTSDHQQYDINTMTRNARLKVLTRVNDCLSAAIAIIKDRSKDYKFCMEKMIASGSAVSSVALQCKFFVDALKDSPEAFLIVSKLVEMAMFEMLLQPCDRSKNDNFASLEFLFNLLRHTNLSVVRSACEAVARFLKDLNKPQTQKLVHKCASCGALPIKGTRFCIDESDHDIDLCSDCYSEGISFAAVKKFNPLIPVLVGNKPILLTGAPGKLLNCHDIRQMSSSTCVSYSANVIMQDSQHDISVGMDEEDDDVQLQFALQMSLESRDNIRELFSSLVFKHLLGSTVTDLSDTQNQRRYYSFFIMNLLLTIVSKCSRSDQKPDLRRSMVEILCAEIGTLSKNCTEEFSSKGVYTITLYLRGLCSLMTEQDNITSRINLYPSTGLQHTERSSTPTKNKTDPRFVCDTHGVPAVRRRCSHGEHKDRRFYVCGMNRKNRCKYFKWADELDNKPKANEKSAITQSAGSTKNEAVVNEEVRSIVWNFINSGNVPLHQQLCVLLQSYIKKKVNLSDSIHSQTDVDTQKPIKIQKLSKSLQSSLRNIQELQNDGSILSLRKLGSLDCPGAFELPFSQDQELQNLVLHKYPIVEALLDFIMLLGTKLSEFASNKSISWDIWYSPLCHIISKGFPAALRNRAKEALKCVTGGKKDTYSQVRDRYLFASQFIDLLSCSESPLQAALAVREKAHRCGTSLYSNIASWATLTTGELLGVQDLISEDYFAVSGMKKLMKVLSILATTVSKSRRENWRYFCSLDQLPNKDAVFESDHKLDSSFLTGEIRERSPITVLFWMTCALPEYAQVKLFPLINVALAGSFHIKSGKVSPTDDKTKTTDKHFVTEANLITRRQYDDHAPEKILLEGSYGLSLNDVCAFTAAFVLKSGNSQIRNHAKEIVLCLIRSFPLESLQLFLQRMATNFITDMCSLGAQSIQFLQLITAIITSGRIEKIDTTHLSRVAISCFTEQATENRTIASKMNRNLFTFIVKNDSTHNCGIEESFDLSRCSCCQSSIVRKRESNTSTETHASSQQPSFPDASKVRENEPSPKWVDGQISEYKRVKIEHHRMICSEFNTYIQLKRRLAIHEIFLNVSDQRGRFVKAITVYFSPRHVNDINELRDDCYDPLWQPCGTLTLARGANKASLKVPFGVIAANLKFEYSEFYDKVNGGRTSAGAMVLHCPRCSRIVNTALGGVCGHCGEVAFQCRKCRHINYDRLDAFLCVECGYCSSGTFSYEMNAGEATSAVSILDEDDLEKMVRTLHTQQKKYDEILSIFKKHIYVDKKLAGRKRSYPNKSMNKEIDCSDGAFKRMLQGQFPKLTIDTAEVGREEIETVSQTAPDARTRSLLDLARQIRGDFSSEIRTSLSDILVQQARFNSGFRSNQNFDDVEDETNILSIDMQDPLSQLVASIQARNRGVSSSSNHSGPIDSKSGTRENKDKSLDILKYCYLELKGIEKDCSEISKRIIAWKRLNQDSLADYGSVTKSLHSLPVVCSECAPKVTASLLELIRELIPRNFNGLGKMLTNKFISCLFDGQSTDSNELAELKKTVLLKIHQNSTMGSDMILKELNSRLHGRKDPTSAEILGLLLQHDSVSHQKFVEFAVKMLGG